MQNSVPIAQSVFTVSEVAAALRISDETIRRKIQSGELEAVQINHGTRATFRILAQDLVAWLGVEAAQKVFGVGDGLRELEQAFAKLPPAEREVVISSAIREARAKAETRSLVGREPLSAEIQTKFAAKKLPTRATHVDGK